MVTLSPPAAVSKHEFSYRNKNTLSFVMVNSALFNNVFKALNLFLNSYIAEIMLHGHGIWLLSNAPYHRGNTQSSEMAWHL
jgi:hypothetical protein